MSTGLRLRTQQLKTGRGILPLKRGLVSDVSGLALTSTGHGFAAMTAAA